MFKSFFAAIVRALRYCLVPEIYTKQDVALAAPEGLPYAAVRLWFDTVPDNEGISHRHEWSPSAEYIDLELDKPAIVLVDGEGSVRIYRGGGLSANFTIAPTGKAVGVWMHRRYDTGAAQVDHTFHLFKGDRLHLNLRTL